MSWHDEVDGALLRVSAAKADLVREAIKDSFDAESLVRSFLKDFPIGSTATPDEARTWAQKHVPIYSDKLEQAFAVLYSTGYVFGQDFGLVAIERARIRKAPNVGINIDWSKWKPGDKPAAALLKPKGGLARLLGKNRSATIKGISKTTLDRVGRILSEGLAAGATNSSIARDFMLEGIRGIADDPIRALTIATTETARAVSVATVEAYQDFGVQEYEWLALDPCEICQENNDAGPIKLGEEFPSGDTEPPAHPNCRCTVLPVVDDGTPIDESMFDIE